MKHLRLDPTAPSAVRRAVGLMVFGAVVQALGVLRTVFGRDDIRHRTSRLARDYKGRTLSGHELEHATSQAYGFSIATGCVFVVLWLVVAQLCHARRPAGRVMATVLTIVYTFTFAFSGLATIGPGTLPGFVLAVTGLVVVYFLWRKPVSAWLSAARPSADGDEPR